jgi:hypothetical protein
MKKLLIIIAAILLLAVPAMAATVELTAIWTPNTEADLAGYRLYYSEITGGPYTFVQEYGKVSTGKTNASMVYGDVLYFILTAFDTEGLESGYSNEASYRLPFPGENRIPPKAPAGLGIAGRVL